METTLTNIQNEVRVPKGSYNSFGKYKYRSAEQILEVIKPVLLKHNASLTLTDEINAIGSKLFLIATASLIVDAQTIIVKGYAELSEHKGMSAEQCTGTASSYARKYALNGLFLIDETEAEPDNEKTKLVSLEKQAEIDIVTEQLELLNSMAEVTAYFNQLAPKDEAIKALFTKRKVALNG